MFPARPPQQQPASASNSSSSGSNPSPTTTRSFTAFLVPPPMTVFVQLGDGLQLQFTPSPERLMSSLMGGVPVIFPVAGAPSSGGGNSFWAGMENEAMMRAMHELFMRSQSEQHGPPPTSKSFLEKLPLKTWNKEACANEKYTDCAICLSEYETDDTVISLPCGHAFHKDCGMPWLVEHNVCPTCRHQLPTAQDESNKPATTTSTGSDNNNSNSSRDAQEGGGEPDEEPEGFEQMLRSLLGVRRPRSPTVSDPQPARVVRQRVEEREPLLPGAVPSDASNNDGNDDDAMLDSMLEEEASRFVEEEKVKRVTQAPADATSANDAAIFDEVDLEELLRDTRPPANCSAASTEA